MTESSGEIVVIKRNGSDGTRFPLHGGKCTFGRDPNCDIRIIRTDVEPQHVTLEYGDGKVWLNNFSQTNPAMINENLCDAKNALVNKDVFSIGGRSFRYECPSVGSRRKSSLVKTPLGSYQGSPRSPVPKEGLRQSIKRLESASDSLKEEGEIPSPLKTLQCDNKENNFNLVSTPGIQGVLKRKSLGMSMSKKRVSFGGNLSPELFDKTLPSNTPLRKGSSPTVGQLSGRAFRRRSSIVSTIPKMEDLSEDTDETKLAALDHLHVDPVDAMAKPSSISDESEVNQSIDKELEDHPDSWEEESSDQETQPRKMRKSLQSQILDQPKLMQTKRRMRKSLQAQILSQPELKETKKKMRKSLQAAIWGKPELKETKKKMRKSLQAAISNKPELKETKKKMRKSLQRAIQEKPVLNVTKRRMRQSLQAAILNKPSLRETKKKLRKSLKIEIQNPPPLKETKKKMRKSLQEGILAKPTLKSTKRVMRKSLQQDILRKPVLKETKKKMRQSLQAGIQNPPPLKVTKRTMRKSLQAEILQKPVLKETKKKMNEALQKEIQSQPHLKATKKVMRKSLQAGIISKPTLKQTKKKLNKVLQDEIKNPPQLKETKKKMRRSLQSQILSKPVLKETKKKMRESLQNEIKNPPVLKATKKSMRKSLQAEILSKPTLKETKKKMNKNLQEEIQNPPSLRVTKRKMRKSIQSQILKRPLLKETKRRMRKSLQMLIINKPQLKETLKKMASPLQKDIKAKAQVKLTRRENRPTLATPIRIAIGGRPALKKTLKRLNTPAREEIKKGMKLKNIKERYPGLHAEIQAEIKSKQPLKRTKLVAPTPLREEIKKGVSLKKVVLPAKTEANPRKLLKARRRLPPTTKTIDVLETAEKPKKSKEQKVEPPRKRARRGSTPGRIKGMQVRKAKTPRTKSQAVEDFVGIARIMKTPKVKRSPVKDDTGFSRLIASPKVKNSPVKDFVGIARIMKTPKVKQLPVEDDTGIAELMTTPEVKNSPKSNKVTYVRRTPKVKNQPVEGYTGISRLMAEPKVKNSPVKDSLGLSRLMKTPKHKNAPVEDFEGLSRIMQTPQLPEDVKQEQELSVSSPQQITAPKSRAQGRKRKATTDDVVSSKRARQDVVPKRTTRSKQVCEAKDVEVLQVNSSPQKPVVLEEVSTNTAAVVTEAIVPKRASRSRHKPVVQKELENAVAEPNEAKDEETIVGAVESTNKDSKVLDTVAPVRATRSRRKPTAPMKENTDFQNSTKTENTENFENTPGVVTSSDNVTVAPVRSTRSRRIPVTAETSDSSDMEHKTSSGRPARNSRAVNRNAKCKTNNDNSGLPEQEETASNMLDTLRKTRKHKLETQTLKSVKEEEEISAVCSDELLSEEDIFPLEGRATRRTTRNAAVAPSYAAKKSTRSSKKKIATVEQVKSEASQSESSAIEDLKIQTHDLLSAKVCTSKRNTRATRTKKETDDEQEHVLKNISSASQKDEQVISKRSTCGFATRSTRAKGLVSESSNDESFEVAAPVKSMAGKRSTKAKVKAELESLDGTTDSCQSVGDIIPRRGRHTRGLGTSNVEKGESEQDKPVDNITAASSLVSTKNVSGRGPSTRGRSTRSKPMETKVPVAESVENSASVVRSTRSKTSGNQPEQIARPSTRASSRRTKK